MATLAGDMSFSEALSGLDLDDLLKDLDKPTRTSGTVRSTYGDSLLDERDVRRQLDQVMDKADACDRLVRSLADERSRIESLASKNSLSSTLRRPADSAVALASAESPHLLQATMERLVQELAEDRKSRDALALEIRLLRETLAGRRDSPIPAATVSPATVSESDAKYKEMKKKLLMANLRILELTSQQQADPQKQPGAPRNV